MVRKIRDYSDLHSFETGGIQVVTVRGPQDAAPWAVVIEVACEQV